MKNTIENAKNLIRAGIGYARYNVNDLSLSDEYVSAAQALRVLSQVNSGECEIWDDRGTTVIRIVIASKAIYVRIYPKRGAA